MHKQAKTFEIFSCGVMVKFQNYSQKEKLLFSKTTYEQNLLVFATFFKNTVHPQLW